MFDLAELSGLAESEAALNPTLSEMSVVLILSACSALADLRNWRGAGDELTPTERDDIDAMVATLYSELLA